MNAPTVPLYMNTRRFCEFSGLSRYQFNILRKKTGLPVKWHGTHNLVNVEQALAALDACRTTEQRKRSPVVISQTGTSVSSDDDQTANTTQEPEARAEPNGVEPNEAEPKGRAQCMTTT